MLDSVRVRLTLWHVAILALLLTTLSTGVYIVLRQNFYEKLGGILKSVCRATISVLAKELSTNPTRELASRNTLAILNFPEYTMAVFDEDTHLLAEKPVGAGARIHIPNPTQVPNSIVHLYTIRTIANDGEFRRVAEVRVRLQPQDRVYTIIVSQSLTSLLGALNADRRILLMVVPVGLLLAGFGGWFLARKSLAPVLAMSEQAHRIGAENLDQRLPIVNPRDELGRLAITFNNLLTRLSSAFSFQREFMADASHELRTPVHVIRTATSVTLERSHRTEDEYRDALAIIDEQVRRLTRIVDDMFQLARAEGARLTLQQHSFYLDELLNETARAARLLGAKRDIMVELPVLPESLFCGDEDLLRRMISNLLDNAIKFTPAGGKVNVNLQQKNGTYFVSVSDTGPGIPGDAQHRVFERFFRAAKGESRSNGLNGPGAGVGLGLSIAKSIAEAHGGILSLAHSDSNGSTFVAALPGRPVSNNQPN
jgi:two-component system OmpR family sensor kinase